MSFVERTASADGFDVRYMDDGEGPPLVCFHGAGGLRLSRGHELLARTRRVIAFEAPGFGESAANGRSGSLRDLAATMLAAIDAVGLERFALWGTSFGGKLALWLAVDAPERLEALVLAAPAAIRLPGTRPQDSGPLPGGPATRDLPHTCSGLSVVYHWGATVERSSGAQISSISGHGLKPIGLFADTWTNI
jgi:pimeloyl-ACP methyl ester carboxylesterase